MVPECVQDQIHQTKIHCHNDNEQEANRRGVELLEMVVFKLTSFAGFHAVGDSREARYRGRTPIFTRLKLYRRRGTFHTGRVET